MASWQGNLFNFIFRLRKILFPASHDLNIARERAELEAIAKIFKPQDQDVVYTGIDIRGILGEWIDPHDGNKSNVILYLHGGSYNAGSINSHRSLATNIALSAKARVLTIDYRLAPEHPFPAPVEDAVAAYHWLLENGFASNRIIIAGDSAGGGLVLACILSLRDSGAMLPAAGICLSPWTDLAGSGASWHTNARRDAIIDVDNLRKSGVLYAGETNLQSPLASPIYANLIGLPPLLIQVGSDEILLSDATSVATQAEEAGVAVTLEIWEEMQHVWQFAAKYLPEGRQAIAQIGRFINAQINQP